MATTNITLPVCDESHTPKVSVVIPNWNGLEHLPDCMTALAHQTFRDFQVIVVDNGSTDHSITWLERNVPQARVVQRADNGGFSAAVNVGIRASESEYVYLLNNDTVADTECLSALVAWLDCTDFDVAASKMVFFESPEVVNAAGDTFDMRHLAGAQRGRGKAVSRYKEPVKVLGACAGAAMYTRSFFDDVGLFDEEFFLVYEDVDVSLRGLICGKQTVYVPESVVRHKDSATINRQPLAHIRKLIWRNQFIVIAKNLPLSLAPLIFVAWCWRMFRDTFPLRPAAWRQIPGLVAQLPEKCASQRAGLIIGLSKRADVWRRRTISRRKITRWILRGTARLHPAEYLTPPATADSTCSH
ncbi:MAG: glycosyltransferase family 2 protein [Coriobacteriia bacterium]